MTKSFIYNGPTLDTTRAISASKSRKRSKLPNIDHRGQNSRGQTAVYPCCGDVTGSAFKKTADIVTLACLPQSPKKKRRTRNRRAAHLDLRSALCRTVPAPEQQKYTTTIGSKSAFNQPPLTSAAYSEHVMIGMLGLPRWRSYCRRQTYVMASNLRSKTTAHRLGVVARLHVNGRRQWS